VGKGDVVVERVGFLSFNNCSLTTSSNETYYCCTTWRSWLVGDTSFFRNVVIGEGTLNKGNHFLNIMSKIGLE
jgi:hypothetical protein